MRQRKVSQQWDETQIHRHWRFNHQYLGGLDEKQNKIQRERRFRTRDARVRSGSASHIPLAHLDLPRMSVHNGREYVLLSFPVIDKSINNLPLFLFDVNMKVLYTIEASFQCARRNQPPKNRRVFLAAGPRSNSQPRASWLSSWKLFHKTRKTPWSKHASRRKVVTDFPEGAAKFCTRYFMVG